MGDLGYRTAFFQAARGSFENRTGLVHNLGFDLFLSREAIGRPDMEENSYFGVPDMAMLAPGLSWSAQPSEQPFFATYLTLASHHDYKVPSDWSPKTWPGKSGKRAAHYAKGLRAWAAAWRRVRHPGR